jgi:acyl dehydratase
MIEADEWGVLADLDEPNHGVAWKDLEVGHRFRTSFRTITEVDLVQFVTATGFFEPLFLDARHGRPDGSPGRAVPGLLTLSFAEGLVMQTRVLHGTGVAALRYQVSVTGPVVVGDTIAVAIGVEEISATSDGVRARVETLNRVFNQRGEVVVEYRIMRLQR